MKNKTKYDIIEKLNENSIGYQYASAFGVLLFLIYFGITKKETEISLISLNINYEEVQKEDSRRATDIVLYSGSKKYRFNLSLWKDYYDTDDVLKKLKSNNSCTIWLSSMDDEQVFGLKSENVFLPYIKGLELHNSNIDVLLILATVFTFIPLIIKLTEKIIRRSITRNSKRLL